MNWFICPLSYACSHFKMLLKPASLTKILLPTPPLGMPTFAEDAVKTVEQSKHTV